MLSMTNIPRVWHARNKIFNGDEIGTLVLLPTGFLDRVSEVLTFGYA